MTAGPSGRDLPTGTVTFLFTDIEGSTRLLQRLGGGYSAVQDRHAEILRSAIQAHGGTEIRTEGDSFFATFPTPAGAVRAAVAAQRALAEERWPNGFALRVRMGLHTGEGRIGGDDYLGIDVNRAARIAAAGHGGQVLLSEATSVLVQHEMPPGVSIRDLGIHRLKDIAHPEHLYDLAIAGLPAGFPAPRTAEARPYNFPLQLTSFIGREAEVGDVAQMLHDHRLVTLTGPGGTGKTRLAIAVAARVLPSFADGAFFVDLAPVADPEQVCPEICQVLGVREEPGSDVIDTLVNRLMGRSLLLVLDNFEHLLEAATLVDRILRAVGETRVLVTSRARLGLYGERERQVPPLQVPDGDGSADPERLLRYEAVALFVDRARAARADFDLAADNAADIADICARLDGLPLAIELAAGQIRLLSPAVLRSRLTHSLDLATRASNLPPRQRTLRATIAWSEDLLDPRERQLFARLSVFVGGGELDAIQEVTSPGRGGDTLDLLGSLVDSSLVRRLDAPEPRFGMLETIREYAAERLDDEGDAAAARRRHAEFFLSLAEAAAPHVTTDIRWLDRLDREHDNLLAAFQWSIDAGEVERAMKAGAAIWRFWQQRGHFVVGRRWMERLLQQPGRRTAIRAAADSAAGSLSYWQADVEGTERHYNEALGIYQELGDRMGVARARYDLAFLPLLTGVGFERSLEIFEELSMEFEELGEEDWLGSVKSNIAFFLLRTGDAAAALPLLEDSVERERERGNLFFTVSDMQALAQAHRWLGQHHEARVVFLECLDLLEEMDSITGIASTLRMMAALECAGGHHERGMRLYGAAEAISARIGGTHPPEALLGDPVADARLAIGEEATDRALAEGRALTRDEAVAYARSSDD